MKKKPEITGFKVNKWWDSDKNTIKYGVDGKVNGKWYHLANGTNDPCWFDTEHEACQEIKKLSKKHGIL